MPTIYINPYIHAAADWWVVPGKTCVAAYQPIGAASLAASYVNLANPGTYDAAPGVAPTWASATGWTFNGSTQYLTTGITPPRDQTWSLLVRYVEPNWSSTGWESLMGSFSTYGGYSGFLVQGRDAIGLHFWTGTTYNNAFSVLPLTGVFGFAGTNSYLDGVPGQTTASGPATGNHLSLWIGGLNSSGALAQPVGGSILACAVYSDTLTAGEVATLSAAMAAL